MTQHDGGKGDKQITPTDKEQFDKNWDTVFKKKEKCCNYNCNQGRDCPLRKAQEK